MITIYMKRFFLQLYAAAYADNQNIDVPYEANASHNFGCGGHDFCEVTSDELQVVKEGNFSSAHLTTYMVSSSVARKHTVVKEVDYIYLRVQREKAVTHSLCIKIYLRLCYGHKFSALVEQFEDQSRNQALRFSSFFSFRFSL